MTSHLLPTYNRAPEVFVSGRGAELVTSDGRVYLDFLAGIAVSALGHAHPRLVRELSDQLGKVVHLSNLYRNEHADAVADRLAKHTGLDAVFFTNSGTEANEAAIKLARKHFYDQGAPRAGLLALEGSFHGRSMGSVSLTHTEKYRKPFEPCVPGAEFVAPGDTARMEALLATKRFAAFFVEPIQGEQGVKEVPHDFLRAARKAADASGTLLVHDEVQAGCGRTGTFLSADAAGIKPDVVTLAKPIAAGLPMGCMVVRRELNDVFKPGDHGSTFAGGALVCRGALVFLDELENGLADAVRARGAELRAGLADLQGDFDVITELRGRGLMQGVRLARGAEDVQKSLYAKGLIVNRTAGDVLRIVPPYVITSEQIARGISILREALSEL